MKNHAFPRSSQHNFFTEHKACYVDLHITCYTYDGSSYNEVTSGTTFDSSVVYYEKGNDCYHQVNITEFDGTTTYYTHDGSTYTSLDNTAVYSETETYYVKADCTFEVQIADVNKLYAADATDLIAVTDSSIIVVTYSAKLTADAATVETNTAYIEYSNNPNDNGSGTGTTPKDKTTVFTFTLDVSKVDSDSSNPLEGAGFTLYKAVEYTGLNSFESGKTYYTLDNGVMKLVDTETETCSYEETYYVYEAVGNEVLAGYQTVTFETNEKFASGVTYYTYNDQTKEYEKVTDTSVDPDASTTYYVKNDFTFEGLGVGYYKLVESTTPDGYNTMEDLYFTIVAVTKEDSDGKASVTSLIIKDATGKEISTGTNPSFTATATTQKITTTIENSKGSTLPSTGGIGTTVFYIVGGILVVGAVVLLITRKRMSSAK